MKKITTVLNSPAKIAGFALCVALIIGLCVFGAIRASAGINENRTIGMDKGVNVALADAGFKSEEVANLTAHYDTEDGASVYEVSFSAGGYKYEYVVKASNGKIIEADRDALTNSATENADATNAEKSDTGNAEQTQTQNSESATTPKTEKKAGTSGTSSSGSASSNYIGVDKAKSVALSDAGLSASAVTFTKAKLDRENGVKVYEIEFFTQDREYEYEIGATDGTIRSKDIERNDDFNDDDDDDFDEDWDD